MVYSSISIKLFKKNEGDIKSFPSKQKLREHIAGRPALQEILKEVPQAKRKQYQMATWIHRKVEYWK